MTAPLRCGSRQLGRDGQRRAARCLTDSSARSCSSAASVSPAPGRGPARFPQPILDARLGDGSRLAICVPPASPRVAITVRPFGTRSFSAAQLIAHGALPAHIPDEAERVCTPAAISSSAAAPRAATRRCSTCSLPSSPTTSGSSPSRTPWSSASTPRTASASRRAGYSRERSQSATSCATPCATGPITSSSAKCAAPKRPTCCKPSTPDPAARSPPSMRTTPTAPCPAWRAAQMQGGGDLPWDVTCLGVVDGIALVIHMTRREGAAIRGRSRPGARLRRRDHYMGQPPTRPRDGPRPSRTHRRILAARQTGGPAAGGDARVRPHS